MTTPDTPTLLANASAGQLLDDAVRAEQRADLVFAIAERESLLRLAELARAVVAAPSERMLDAMMRARFPEGDRFHTLPASIQAEERAMCRRELCAAMAALASTRHTQGES